eukprot:tig00000025_g7929.t1
MARARDLYQRQVGELHDLLDGMGLFPAGAFDDAAVLAVLSFSDWFGLRRVLSATDAIAVARRAAAESDAELSRRLISHLEENIELIDGDLGELRGVPWLPAASRPSSLVSTSLEWKPCESGMAPPVDAWPAGDADIASATRVMVDVSVHSERLLEALGWKGQRSTVALGQLQAAQRAFEAGSLAKAAVDDVVAPIYSALDNDLFNGAALKGLAWVWTGDAFHHSVDFAKSGIHGVDASPLLLILPPNVSAHRHLVQLAGIKEKWSVGDYVRMSFLGKLHAKSGGQPLSTEQLNSVVAFLGAAEAENFELPPTSIFVPTEGGILVPPDPSQCAFNDAPNFLVDQQEAIDSTDETTSAAVPVPAILHKSISPSVASFCGVPMLSATVLNTALHPNDGEIEEYDLQEDLTDRIAGIVGSYGDGPVAVRELIQNSDDDGDTKVALCYDQASFGTKTLLSEPMALQQSESLVWYQDRVIAEKGWTGLVRLGRGAKQDDDTKIGRFGEGFSSVHIFTDTPMILSGSSAAVLDATRKHQLPERKLANGKGVQRTGARLCLPRAFRLYRDQFKPFHGLFAFDLDAEAPFPGAIIRLALRTHESVQFTGGVISKKTFSEQQIFGLLRSIVVNADEYVLFLQNVTTFDICHRAASAASGKEQLLARITREIVEKDPAGSDPFRIPSPSQRQQNPVMSASALVIIKVEVTELGAQLLELKAGVVESRWRVCSLFDGSAAKRFWQRVDAEKMSSMNSGSVRQPKYVPFASIAARVFPVPDANFVGQVFSCLGTGITTGFPVHLNAVFTLSSNRHALVSGKDADDKVEGQWNVFVMHDLLGALAQAELATALLEIC